MNEAPCQPALPPARHPPPTLTLSYPQHPSSPKATLLSQTKSMFPPRSEVPPHHLPIMKCPTPSPPILVFIILINQEHCTCLSVLRVALSRKKGEVIKVAGKACWGFGLGQRWWCESDKMNWIQMPKLSLNPPPSLPPSPHLKPSLAVVR